MRSWVDCVSCGTGLAIGDVHRCPSVSEWRDDDRSRAKALVYTLVACVLAIAGVATSALTVAGVIPS